MTIHSFAVLAYKDSPFLPLCLESLKRQTLKSEIYISTSTPSPYISTIAANYEVDIVTTEPDQGIAHDWRFALRQAKTKYVTLAHQDDIYLPNYTERCVAASERFSDTLICFTDYSEVTARGERRHTSMLNVKRLLRWSFMPVKKNIQSKFAKRLSQSFGSSIPCPSVMYNIDMLSSFRFSGDYTINMDWDAWLRMADMTGTFVYLPQILLQHRIHSDSATSVGLGVQARQREDLKIFGRLWPKAIAAILARLYSRSYSSNEG
jgi:hypothetical protein